MNLKRKLLLAFLTCAFVFCLSNLISLFQLNQFTRQSQDIVNVNLEKTILLQEMSEPSVCRGRTSKI